MPKQTQQAVDWSLQRTIINPWGFEVEIKIDDRNNLVSSVRDYFNDHNIDYSTFDYQDVLPYAERSEFK